MKRAQQANLDKNRNNSVRVSFDFKKTQTDEIKN